MMQIRIAGKQIEIGEALPQHVRRGFMKERLGFGAMQFASTQSDAHESICARAREAFRARAHGPESHVRRYMRQLKTHHGRGGHLSAGPA